jgi:hypothetical protein
MIEISYRCAPSDRKENNERDCDEEEDKSQKIFLPHICFVPRTKGEESISESGEQETENHSSEKSPVFPLTLYLIRIGEQSGKGKMSFLPQ